MPWYKKKYHQLSDEQLVYMLTKGNERAFDELYDRYAPRMMRFFYRMLYQDEAVAADFCQTLFLRVFEKKDSFKPEYKFSTWIHTLAANLCKNEYRRQGRQPTTINIQQAHDLMVTQEESRVDKSIFQSALQRAINRLDDKHRICIVLRYQQDKRIAEIADIVNCPPGTVKSRIHTAMKQMRSDLHGHNLNFKEALR